MKQYENIQQKLKNYSVSVDKDKLWQNTSHAIPRKKDRKGFFWFFLGIAGMALAVLFLTKQNNSSNEIALTTTGASTASNKLYSSTVQESNTVSIDMGTQTTGENTSATSTTKPQSNNKAAATIINNQNLGNTTQKNIVSENKTTKTANRSASAHATPKKDQKTNQKKSTAFSKEFDLKIKNETNQNSDLSNLSNLQRETTDQATIQTPFNAPSWMSATIASLEATQIPTDIESISLTNQPVGIKPAKTKRHLYLTLMQGIGFSNMQITSAEPQYNYAAAAWNHKMKSLENVSTSLHVQTKLSNIFSISGGLQYARLSTQLDQLITKQEDYIQHGLSTIVIDESGNVENFYDDVHVIHEIQSNTTWYTQYHKLDVALLVQAALLRSQRMETGVWVKGGLNLLYRASGTTFDQEGILIPFTGDENPYHLASPFTYGFGVGTMYRMDRRWTLNARIGYEQLMYTHGFFEDKLTFKHGTYNISLGTSYTL